MEFFRIKKDIPFMRHALLFNAISALTLPLCCRRSTRSAAACSSR